MNRWKRVLRYGLVLILGAVIGGLGVLLVIKQGVKKWQTGDQVALVMNRLTRQLELTPAQQAEIAPIVKAAWIDMRLAGIQQVLVLQRTTAEIRTRLEPRQQARLDALLARLRQNWKGIQPGDRLPDGQVP